MDIAAYFALIIVLATLLGKAADLIEDGFVKISRKLKVSSFLTGFIAISFASSLPEVSVTVNSAVEGEPALSVGHLLGATLILITLILGANTLVHKRIPFKGSYGVFQVLLTALVLGSPLVALIDKQLTRTEGVMLILIYFLFMLYMISKGTHRYADPHNVTITLQTLLFDLLPKAIIGLIGLIVLSKLVVDAAIKLAVMVHIPSNIIGLLVLALGTNIPEITILLRSRTVEQKKLVIGNIMGSASLNTGVIGLLALLSPYSAGENFSTLIPVIVVTAISLLLVTALASTGKELTRREGYFLLVAYAAFIAWQLIILVV